MKKRGALLNNKGQATIFIIIAIVIVVAGLLIFFLVPRTQTTQPEFSENPRLFIDACIKEDIQNAVKVLSSQGGYLEPDHYILYNNERIQYLCYTNENYKTCSIQQPFLVQHIQEEVKNNITSSVDECFNSLKEEFEKQDYRVNIQKGGTLVELFSNSIVSTFNYTVVLTKEDSQIFENFRVVLNNNLYELVSVTNSILNWEAIFGDAETTLYMNALHYLKVEKKKQTDGSTIYILTNRDSGNKFQFATRSLVVPPGYV